MDLVRSTDHLYLVQAVLLRPLDLSPGGALLHKDNGVGFSVSVLVAPRASGILRRFTRPQPSNLTRCMYISNLLLGSTHSFRQFPREVETDGLDVGSMVSP